VRRFAILALPLPPPPAELRVSPMVRSQASSAGPGPEGLYKPLSAQGNPRLDTIFKIVKALGPSNSVCSPAIVREFGVDFLFSLVPVLKFVS